MLRRSERRLRIFFATGAIIPEIVRPLRSYGLWPQISTSSACRERLTPWRAL